MTRRVYPSMDKVKETLRAEGWTELASGRWLSESGVVRATILKDGNSYHIEYETLRDDK